MTARLPDVERLVHDLYSAGVDAIIVQDMSLLRMNLPPIAFHASTQCDNRTPEKCSFLSSASDSRRQCLQRELSLEEIAEICRNVDRSGGVFRSWSSLRMLFGALRRERGFGQSLCQPRRMRADVQDAVHIARCPRKRVADRQISAFL